MEMAQQKIVKKILEAASKDKAYRHRVSSKIKNFPKAEQEEAINYVLKNGYVQLSTLVTDSRGRNPVIIAITQKGVDALKVMLSFDHADTKWRMTD